MKKSEVLELTERMYNHLEEAYKLAGGLRDVFSGEEWKENAGHLKERCNRIRHNIGLCQSHKTFFLFMIKNTKGV